MRRNRISPVQIESVLKVIRLIEEEYGRSLSLKEMADYAFYSPYHFERLFQKVSGVTPCQFLSALRIEKAKQLLLETDLDIATISSYVGYSSFSTFSRQFKEYVGLSPINFRKLSSQTLENMNLISHYRDGWFDIDHGSPVLRGHISAPIDFRGIIFVALFPEAMPKSAPAACAILRKPGEYQIKDVPDGNYYIFSIAFKLSFNPIYYLLPKKALRGTNGEEVTVKNGKVLSGKTDVSLRPPLPSDPPVSVSIPYLVTNFIAKFKESSR